MDLISAPLDAELAVLAQLPGAERARLDVAFRKALRTRGFGAAAEKAMCAITPAAAARMRAAGRSFAEVFEQVNYSGRRLAKLNISPEEITQALRSFGAPAPQLGLATLLALHEAFYQVREAETQAFYGLFRAEAESRHLDDLLERAVDVLTLALRAQAGRLVLADRIPPPLRHRLGRPRYIAKKGQELLLDEEWRGRYASCWSVPFKTGPRMGAVVQFGFSKPYPWLPRELQLLEAAAERCLAAVERRRLVEDLAAREADVRRLAGHMLDVEERERRRIRRELHDEAGQSLMLLRLEIEKLEHAAQDETARGRLAEVREIAERTIAEMRRAFAALSPAVLEQLGLPAALRQLGVGLAKTTGAGVRVRVTAPPGRLPAQTESVVYRLAQECCHNIARHARATRVNLSLVASDRWLELKVGDDGLGFDVEAALRRRDSFGMAGMQERVSLMGGTLRIASRPGRGSTIAARLPLP